MTFLQLKKIFSEKLQGKYVLFGNPNDPASTNAYWMRMNGIEGANIVGGHHEDDNAVARKLEMIMQKIQSKSFTVYDDEDSVKKASQENQKKKAIEEEADEVMYDGTQVQESPIAPVLDEISNDAPVEEVLSPDVDQGIDINDFVVDEAADIAAGARASVGHDEITEDAFESFSSEKKSLPIEEKGDETTEGTDVQEEESTIVDEKEEEKELEEKSHLMSGLRKKGIHVGEVNPNFHATPPKLSEKDRREIEEEQKKKEDEQKKREKDEKEEEKNQEMKRQREEDDQKERERLEIEQRKRDAEVQRKTEQEEKEKQEKKHLQEEKELQERKKLEAEQSQKEEALQSAQQREQEQAQEEKQDENNPDGIEDIFESFGGKKGRDGKENQSAVKNQQKNQQKEQRDEKEEKIPTPIDRESAQVNAKEQIPVPLIKPIVNYGADLSDSNAVAPTQNPAQGSPGATRTVASGVVSSAESSFVKRENTPGELPLLEAIDLFWKNPQHEHAKNAGDFIADVEKFSNQYFSHFSDQKMRIMYGWQTLRESASESFHVSTIFSECESKFGPQALNKYIHSLPNR